SAADLNKFPQLYSHIGAVVLKTLDLSDNGGVEERLRTFGAEAETTCRQIRLESGSVSANGSQLIN
ncbi:MAG: hypothetical protein JWP03_614, partial [Phycisphaerales bacterium]|nr:hypothetical protein [Phycisphaerales bacterium]